MSVSRNGTHERFLRREITNCSICCCLQYRRRAVRVTRVSVMPLSGLAARMERVQLTSFAFLVLIVGLTKFGVAGQRKVIPGPESLFIFAEVVSDASPFWFKYILDLSPKPNGVSVRWIRVAPLGEFCSANVSVKAMTRLLNTSVGNLVHPNVCPLSPQVVERSLSRAQRRAAIFDTVGFALVARCGGSERIFHLPLAETVDMDRLKRRSQEVAALYDLYYRITQAAFQNRSFYNISREEDRELQEQGSAYVPELESGHFDAGLSKGSMKDILASYLGVRPEPEPIAQLVIPDRESFTQYIVPVYPPLAKQARIQGNVEFEINVDQGNGSVQELHFIGGHRLLQESARVAAMQWRFDPVRLATGSIRVTLKYTLGCD